MSFKKRKTTLLWILIILLSICLLGTIFFTVFYIHHFSDNGFSGNPRDWEDFGSLIIAASTMILSALATYLVYENNQKVRELEKKHTTIEERKEILREIRKIKNLVPNPRIANNGLEAYKMDVINKLNVINENLEQLKEEYPYIIKSEALETLNKLVKNYSKVRNYIGKFPNDSLGENEIAAFPDWYRKNYKEKIEKPFDELYNYFLETLF